MTRDDRPSPDDETLSEASNRSEDETLHAGETISSSAGETIGADPSMRTTLPSAPRGLPISEIDNYHLLEAIGQGGGGVVYLAEQSEPVRRRVALKVIRSGMDSAEIVARFEAERQALAVMDHPNIAKVFDAGVTNDGRPYFAMEYVPGIPITDYCDLHQMPIRDRLEIFGRICDAVQHAHQKGIIHRDIKSSNVLIEVVDDEPMPKVIDFGVAKATVQNLMETSVYTEQGQLLGTPEYMSPEQAEMTGLNIDTRTDIYSLGTLLYELLIGALPFDSKTLRSAGYAGIQKILRDVEPPKPTERLATLGEEREEIARRRRTTPSKLDRLVRGDLEWITMMAMEKDRTLRYASASGLALDIRRHLNDEPVAAGPPGVLYRLGKMRRRHRALFAGIAAVAVALVAGVAGTTWQAIRATRAEEKAVEEAAVATAVNEFLTDMLAEANPERNQDREVTLREVLDNAATRVEESFTDQPKVHAAVRNTIGNTYLGLGRYDEAEGHLRAALATRELDPTIPIHDLAESRRNLGRLYWSKSDYEAAEPLIRDALKSYRELYGDDNEQVVGCLTDLAVVRQTLGDYGAAEAMLREALERSRSLFGNESAIVAEILNNLAWIRKFRGDRVEAVALSREALQVNRKILGTDHPNVLVLGLNLAAMVQELGEYGEAEELFRDTLERMSRVLGPEHPVTLQARMSLGEMYLRQDDADAAEPLLRETLEAAERTLGSDHQVTIALVADVGWALRVRGDLAAAEEFYRETLVRRARAFGEDHPLTIRSRWQVSRLLVDQGKYEAGEEFARVALEAARRVLPEENENLTSTLVFLGLALVGQERGAEAEPFLRECYESRVAALPEGRWEIAHARSALGAALAVQGRFEEAEPLLVEAAEALRDDPVTPPIRTRNAVARVADLYARWNRADPDAGKARLAARWSAELGRLSGAS